jgi:dephospho-CoA kinase
MMKLIGLTGMYCAGKNYVASLLEQRSLPVLDVDKLGHEVIAEEKERLVSRFGEDILGPGGIVDRRRLGQKVFGDPMELAALEEIIHPAANRKTLEWINERNTALPGAASVINAALLHRSVVFEDLDAVIIVEAPVLVRLLRARKRDKLPWAVLFKRFRSQNKFTAQYFRKKTDIYRVKNSFFGSRKKLEESIAKILSHQRITRV